VRVRVLIDGGGNWCSGCRTTRPRPRPTTSCRFWRATPISRSSASATRSLRFDTARWYWWTAAGLERRRNFAHEAFFDSHDLSFVFDGPLVPRLQERYEAYWQHQGGAPI